MPNIVNGLGQIKVGVKPTPAPVPLLLNTYSGAIAAYSLRKLNMNYSGVAIRVRRSSDNTTLDVGFKSDGTLDTTALLTFVGANNGFVSIWYDQSGNGYNLIQNTAANQFRIVYGGGLDTLNGKVSVVSNYNYANHAFATVTLGTTYYQPITIMHIGSHTNSASKWLWATLSDSNPNRIECYQESNNLLSLYAGANMRLSYTPSINTQRLIYAKYDSTNSLLAINNGAGSIGNSGLGRMAGISLNLSSADYSAISYIQEFLIFQGNQDSNRTGISSNINSFYSIYTPPIASPIITDGLILNLDASNTSSYPGTGTVWTDLSSNGNNGTLTNGVGYSSTNGGIMTFDGVNDFVQIENNSSLSQTSALTLSTWVKLNSLSSDTALIGKQWCNMNQYSYLLMITTQGKISFNQPNVNGACNGTYGEYTSTNSLSLNTWYNVVMTFTNTSIKLYLNGQLMSGTLTGYINNLFVSTSPVLLGTYRSLFGNYGLMLNGSMGSTLIYNKSLSASEVTQNYNATKSRFGL